MTFRLALTTAAFLLLTLLAACGDDEEQAASSPSPSPSASATASAAPTAAPTQAPVLTASPGSVVPAEVAERRVVLLRDVSWLEEIGGLWISRLDGVERIRLTREGETGRFAGLATHYETGNETAYYVTVDGDSDRSLWGYDLVTGERTVVLTFESFRAHYADASVTAEGRYVAYASYAGIDMLDRATGTARHLLTNGEHDCMGFANCFSYSRPRWSPDGSLLMVRKTFWEGGTTVIVSPFGKSLEVFTNDVPLDPHSAAWSTTGRTACAYGRYDSPSGLYLADAPSWEFINALPAYEELDSELQYVLGCSFFDDHLVAFGVGIDVGYDEQKLIPRYGVEVRVFDREIGEDRLVREVLPQVRTGAVIAIPGSRLILTQQFIDEDLDGEGPPTRPELIDIDTGGGTWVLEEGDVLVELVP
jgi:hypothetical protein